jgi:hypothetical protein
MMLAVTRDHHLRSRQGRVGKLCVRIVVLENSQMLERDSERNAKE